MEKNYFTAWAVFKYKKNTLFLLPDEIYPNKRDAIFSLKIMSKEYEEGLAVRKIKITIIKWANNNYYTNCKDMFYFVLIIK